MYKKTPDFSERPENKIELHVGSDRHCKLLTVLQIWSFYRGIFNAKF